MPQSAAKGILVNKGGYGCGRLRLSSPIEFGDEALNILVTKAAPIKPMDSAPRFFGVHVHSRGIVMEPDHSDLHRIANRATPCPLARHPPGEPICQHGHTIAALQRIAQGVKVPPIDLLWSAACRPLRRQPHSPSRFRSAFQRFGY